MRVVPLVVSAWLGAGCDGVWDLVEVPAPDSSAMGGDGKIDGSCAEPVGHDEDSDGFDDRCDPCPFDARNVPDDDDDGIANVCDPEPLVPNQVLLFTGFDPTSSQTLVAYNGIIDEDVFRATDGAAGAVWAKATNRMHVIADFSIAGFGNAGSFHEAGVMFGASMTGQQGLGCVLGAGSSNYLEVYVRNQPASPDDGILSNGSPIPLQGFSGQLRAYYGGGSSVDVGCGFTTTDSRTVQIGTSTTDPVPASGNLALFALNVDVSYRFLFVTTRP